MAENKRSTKAGKKEDLGPSSPLIIDREVKANDANIEAAARKALSLFRDEFISLLDKRIAVLTERLVSMEQSNTKLHQEYGERIHGLEQALNDVTERCLSLESRVDKHDKDALEPKNIPSKIVDDLRSEAHRGIIIANDMEQYSRRCNIRINAYPLRLAMGSALKLCRL